MKEKVLIFCSEVRWTTHLGTTLEIVQKHIDKNDDVAAVVCNDELEYCDQNLSGSKEICKLCINKRSKGFALLSEKIRQIEISFTHEDRQYIDESTSMQDIKEIQYENYDVGMAAISSLVSRYRNAVLSINDKKLLFNKMINNGISLYKFFKDVLQKEKPTKVYIFNGRFIYDKALLRACESLGIEYITFDGGEKVNKYVLFHNFMAHDRDKYVEDIMNFWERSDVDHDDKIKIAEQFYLGRRYGAKDGRAHFVSTQSVGKLPENWNPGKKNITIYTVSEDEFAAIGDDWTMKLYVDQLDGLRKIKKSLEQIDSNVIIYVRIHPNSKNTNPKFFNEIIKLNSATFNIIMPESDVSSYTLLESSDRIIAYGSTMGIEASYWNRTSINIGRSYYEDLDVSYAPKSHEEVLNLIMREHLDVKNNINVYKFAYYHVAYGEHFKYYQPINDEQGLYNGVDLHKYNFDAISRLKDSVRGYVPGFMLQMFRDVRGIKSEVPG